jgi:hypothetical protein
MIPDPGAFAHDLTGISEADALFAALDQTAIDDGVDRWTASVLRIHGDERHWWVDVAIAPDSSVNVILQLSRRASASHAVAALRTWRPDSTSRPVVLKTMCRY